MATLDEIYKQISPYKKKRSIKQDLRRSTYRGPEHDARALEKDYQNFSGDCRKALDKIKGKIAVESNMD